jgi:putative transposase
MKSYKYKLKPSPKIIAIFESWLALLCELYNAALQERRDAYRISGLSISKGDQEKQLPEIKRENPRLAAIHSQVIQEALRRVDLAFQHFFRRLKEGQVPGFPRFRSPSRVDRSAGCRCRCESIVAAIAALSLIEIIIAESISKKEKGG